MASIFLATFGAVFIAEIVGDKLLYTTGVLAARYRAASVICGMAAAFSLKMGVAVAVGGAIARLPRIVVASVTAAGFIGVALALWHKPDVRAPNAKDARMMHGAMIAFAAIFFSEWADVGMVVAGTMAARFVWAAGAMQEEHLTRTTAAIIVWLGAVSAMFVKGVVAVTLGAGVRRRIADRVSPRVVRYVAISVLLVLGGLSVMETLRKLPNSHNPPDSVIP